ncbi:F-box protein At4g00893-like [Cornus florida]|uniref:F-box protein At4g00893-like n=1 Tax=Cornus florida TaxID=4283 RepID=UPI00289DA491|nr:F-box protein At4g00893-like [Cornus florida]
MENKDIVEESMNKVSHIIEYKRRKKRSWADLPQELLEQIMTRLSFTDQIRFRATCKELKSVARTLPMDQLPWLVSYDNDEDNGGSYTLCPPSNIYTYTFRIEPEDPAYMIFNPIKVCASNFGWLLLYEFPHKLLFFFNPFKNEVIELPPLEVQHCEVASFSSPPTQPDCIIFVLDNSCSDTKITICPLKDKKWTMYEFDTHFHPVENVVYFKRSFYCAEINGALGVFNLEERKWKTLPESKAIPKGAYKQKTYLVEGTDGELLLVMEACLFSWIRVYKLDFAKMRWVIVEKLEKRTLFLIDSTSIATYTTVRDMVDRYHYISDGLMMFYSNKAGRRYPCTKKYYGVDAENFGNMWIQPPY